MKSDTSSSEELQALKRSIQNVLAKELRETQLPSVEVGLDLLSSLDQLVVLLEGKVRVRMVETGLISPHPPMSSWTDAIHLHDEHEQEILRSISNLQVLVGRLPNVAITSHDESPGRIAVRFDAEKNWVQVNFSASPLPWPAVKVDYISFSSAAQKLTNIPVRNGDLLATMLMNDFLTGRRDNP